MGGSSTLSNVTDAWLGKPVIAVVEGFASIPDVLRKFPLGDFVSSTFLREAILPKYHLYGTATNETTAADFGKLVANDVTPPDVTDKTLTISGGNVSWTKATDNATPQNQLRYFVYCSRNAFIFPIQNNTPLNPGGTLDINTLSLGELQSGVTYRVTVTVEDLAGNRTRYTDTTVTP
jgi:hypothetical protein